jgi:hypothetical protein
VAVPAPLRDALTLQRGLREAIRKEGFGYDWLFTTLHDFQRTTVGPERRLELLRLRLLTADRLCRAPDYADQAVGTHYKGQTLRELAHSKDLPEPEQLAWRREEELHRRAFASFPVSHSITWFTASRLIRTSFPSLAEQRLGVIEGPGVLVGARGTLMLFGDAKGSPARR